MGTQTAIFVEPWGGTEGASPFDDGSYSGVAKVIVKHEACIISIQIQYHKDGDLVWSEEHGGLGPRPPTRSEVNLDYPSEYLTGISGHYSPMSDAPTVIRSLKFTTNKKTHGPFGEEEGTPFTFQMRGGKIVGFAGTTGWYVDNIGCHIRQS